MVDLRREMKQSTILILSLIIFVANATGQTTNTNPEAAKIVTSDIDLFWKAYDRAKPENDLVVYRDEYLNKGSAGLKEFTRLRIGSSCALVDMLGKAPRYYAALREPSLKVGSYEKQIRTSFHKLKEIYPAATFPDVYFVIGKMNSAGTTSSVGLFIGVDMFGKNPGAPLDELLDWHRAVIGSTDRLPNIVAHELVHFEQKYAEDNTLLGLSLKEGIADFIAGLIAGDTINPQLHKYGNPIEKELWLQFQKEMNGTDSSNWLYQGDKAKDKPADLGYYVGYKIAESYYKNAVDKKQAVIDLLGIQDFPKFLASSHYDEKFAAN